MPTALTFTVPIPRADDTLPPSLSQTRVWRNSGRVDLLPLTGVQLNVEAVSTRDLRDYGDSTTMGRLLRQQRETFLGMDIGVETQRSLTSGLSLTPRVASWIRPRLSAISGFNFSRDPNARQPIRTDNDSSGEFRVPAAYNNTRRLDLARAARHRQARQRDLRTWASKLARESGGRCRLRPPARVEL
jgi:hypothetical protein